MWCRTATLAGRRPAPHDRNSPMPGNTVTSRRAGAASTSLGRRVLPLLAILLAAGLTDSIGARAQDAGPPVAAPQAEPRVEPEAQPRPGLPAEPSATSLPQPAAGAPATPGAGASSGPAAPQPQVAPAPPSTVTPSTDSPPPASQPDQPASSEPAPAGAGDGLDRSAIPNGEAAGDAPSESAAAPVPAAEGTLPHDLSPWGMFMAADIVVKAVMIGLAFASLVTWTAWLAKSIELWIARRQLRRAIHRISGAESLSDVANDLPSINGAAAALVAEAVEEVTRSLRVVGQIEDGGVQERVTSRLSRVEAAANRRMMFGTGLLATIGSTAPFVGLFGTVWGIMNSFIGISQSQTTNLAVVAPGIAEALLATGLGLVAAIPAVIIYNSFANRIAGYRLLLADASAGVERLVSLDLDLRRAPRAARGIRAGSAAE